VQDEAPATEVYPEGQDVQLVDPVVEV